MTRPAAGLRRFVAAAPAPLRGPYLYGLIALAALLTTAAYQIGGDFRWDMGDRNLGAFLVNFTGPERAGDVPFRWTAPSARLQAPLLGAFAGTAVLRLNGESWGGPPREATVQINDGPLHSIRLTPGWNDYAVPFSRDDLAGGDLKVRLRIPEAQIPPGQRDPRDTRHLGVPVASIAVDRTGRAALPPLGMVAGAAAGAALIYALGVWLGARPRRAALAPVAFLLMGMAALGLARLPAALAAPGLLGALALAVALALLLRPLLTRLFGRGGVRVTQGEWQALVALFVGALVVKATGLLDPQFITLDHYARLHRLMDFGADPLGFLQNFLNADQGQTYAGQLGLTAVAPYSPLFYLAFSPLNLLVPDPDARLQAINLVVSALDASNVFFLYYAAKRAWGDGAAGVWAGAVFLAFPLGNLLFSDGGYPGIFATWLLVLTTAALAWAYPRLGRPRALLPVGALLALALLAHTAQALLLGVTLVLFVLLVAWRDRARLPAVAGWAGLGLAVSFLAFYQFTAGQVVTRLLPEIWSKLQSGGGIGKSPAKLGAPLLSGFWPQIAAHFAAWPAPVGLAGFAPAGAAARATQAPAARGLALWLLASVGAFLLFGVADVWVNLLQKHMIYIMPALALLNGLALAWLWRRGRAGRALALALWGVLIVASLSGWVARVVSYVLPPGSG